MNKTSFFIEDKALFGGHPTQEHVTVLEEFGVRHFIDLTYDNEFNIIPYQTKYNHISYPINDLSVPTDCFTFTQFIYQICEIIINLKEDEKIYVHCKGGHGRSGIVVACILHELVFKDVDEALEHTMIAHSKRLEMRLKWRIIGSPQTDEQKKFVRHICNSMSHIKC